jgi:hypothetical protein
LREEYFPGAAGMEVRSRLHQQSGVTPVSNREDRKMQDGNKTIQQEFSTDEGIDRRDLLQCLAWVGTGLVCSVAGGIATVAELLEAVPPSRRTRPASQATRSLDR